MMRNEDDEKFVTHLMKWLRIVLMMVMVTVTIVVVLVLA